MEREIRMIYKEDLLTGSSCPVFRLNRDNECFEQIDNEDFRLPLEDVVDDSDFMIFVLNGRCIEYLNGAYIGEYL